MAAVANVGKDSSGLPALKAALEKITADLRANHRRNAHAKELAEVCTSTIKEIDSHVVLPGKRPSVSALQADTDALLLEMETTIAVTARVPSTDIINTSNSASQTIGPSVEENIVSPYASGIADAFWPALRRALHPKSPAKVREITLDTIQKLIAHQQLRCMTPLLNAGVTTKEQQQPILYPPNPLVIDEVIHIVCTSSPVLSDYASTEEPVLIQVIKVLLTAVTSPACEVHDVTLLKALQTSFNIFLYSRNKTITHTTKAALWQIVSLVATRMEKFGSYMEAQSRSQQPPDSTLDVQDNSRTLSASVDPVAQSDYPGAPATNLGTPVLSAEALQNTSSTDNPTATDTDTGDGKDVPELLEDGDNDTAVAPDLVSAEVLEAASGATTNELFSRDSTERSEVPLPILPSNPLTYTVPTQEYIRACMSLPNDPILGYYYEVLRRDLYLCLRALNRLSVKTFNEREPVTQLQDEQSYTTRCRVLSLELILTTLNNTSTIFKTQPIFLDLMRSELCGSLSRNGVSPNAMIFQLSVSIFSILFRTWRNHLKLEVEVIFNEIYLPILSMENSSNVQKILVLQCIQNILANPQALIELYANYDCDLSMASLFERLVGIVTKAITNAPADQSAAPAFGIGGLLAGWMSSSEPVEGKEAQEKKLRFQALCTLRSIVRSMLCAISLPSTQEVGLAPLIEPTLKKAVSVAVEPLQKQQDVMTKSSMLEEPIIMDNKLLDPLALCLPPIVVGNHDENQQQDPGSNTEFDKAQANLRYTSSQSPTGQEIEENLFKKALLKTSAEMFNAKPSKGIDFLVSNNLAERTPKDIATFLYGNASLNKKCIGEYLGEGDAFNIAVMHQFVEQMNFGGMRFVGALRHFLQAFRLPGEAQKIVIMLNTDLHSKQVKHKMDKPAFLRNNRGINNNTDLPEDYLSAIYDEVHQLEIVMDEDPLNQLSSTKKNSEMDDEARREMYKKETLSMQKRSQARIKEVRQKASPWLSTALPDYIRPMLSVAWASFLPTFIQAFEDAPDMSSSDYQPGSLPSHEANIEDTNLTAALALDSIIACIRIACRFELATEREAFISCLASLTRLVTLPDARSATSAPVVSIIGYEMKQELGGKLVPNITIRYKHIAAVKALIQLAQELGDSFDSSWIHALRVISQIELLTSVLTGATPVAALTASIMIPGANAQPSGSPTPSISNTSPLTNDSFDSSRSPGVRASVEESVRSLLLTRPMGGMFGQRTSSTIPAGPTSDMLLIELQAQTLAIAVDRLFTTSSKLSGKAIIWFFSSLCQISIDEIESGSPRSYSLEKIVEMCNYNMHRIRYEWSQIWRLLQQHFNVMGVLPDPRIATFAVDSLRQLCIKFLEKNELAHFHTQTEFLKPFEHIMRHTKSDVVRELVLQSVRQLVQSRAANIKSGWKSIFVVLSRVTTTSGGQAKALVQHSFGVLQSIYEQHLRTLGSSFAEFSSCLVDFALLDMQEVAEKALTLLRGCFQILSARLSSHLAASTLPLASIDDLSARSCSPKREGATFIIDEDEFFLKWLPILSGFSKVAVDSNVFPLRLKALEYMFTSLRSTGVCYSTRHWSAILKGALMPVFQEGTASSTAVDAHKTDGSNGSSATFSIWIQSLRFMVDLYCHQTANLLGEQEYIDGMSKVVTSFIGCKHENLAQCAIICWNQVTSYLINKSWEQRVPASVWASCITCIDSGFFATLPLELTRLGEIQAAPDVTMSRDELLKTVDFGAVMVKCAVHLAAVQAVKEASDTIEKIPASTVKLLPTSLLHSWLRNIRSSYEFAKKFNENEALRNWIWKIGFTGQAPNLMKQETMSMGIYFSLLFTLYTACGDAGLTDQGTPVVETLVNFARTFLRDFLQLQKEWQTAKNENTPTVTPTANHASSKERLLTSWCPIVITIYKSLMSALWADRESLFDSSESISSDPPYIAILGIRSIKRNSQNPYPGIAAYLQEFYAFGLALMDTEYIDIRLCVLDFLKILSACEIMPSWPQLPVYAPLS